MKNIAFILFLNPDFSGRGGFLKIALCIFIFTTNTVLSAQTAHTFLRKADRDYLNNDYKSAEENYTKAQKAERSSKGDYNLANSIYQQQRYDEAAKQYGDIAAKTQDNKLKFNSLYNKGNAHFWKKEYDKAIDSYKNALRMNPNDMDAKKNLALAQRMLQQQQQQQKDKENQDKNNKNDNKDNKDKQNEQNQDQNKDKQDPNQKDKKEQNQQQQNPQQNQQQQAQQEMKKDQARQILQIMDDEERKVQQRLRKGTPKPSRSTKDW